MKLFKEKKKKKKKNNNMSFITDWGDFPEDGLNAEDKAAKAEAL